MTFGEWIRESRGSRSATECAARAEVSLQLWSGLENNRTRRRDGKASQPQIETIETVAKGLNVSVDEVMAAAYAMEKPDYELKSLLDGLTQQQKRAVINVAKAAREAVLAGAA